MSTKVLLVSDVKRIGWLGDVVEVAEGYARNYLLPQGLAVAVTEANLKSIAKEKTKHAEKRVLVRQRMEQASEAVNGAEVVIAAKANELGHLFGSVGPSQIALNLREQGFEVADEIVVMDENIKQVDTTEVTIRFAEDLKATVSVVVVAEQEQDNEPAKESEPKEE